jgi:hypothetical protein
MRFPIGLKIFGIAVGLLILMAAAALLRMRMTRTGNLANVGLDEVFLSSVNRITHLGRFPDIFSKVSG